MPTMGFISASLGVGCDHCHVPGSFEKDDKKPKLFAREMMKMMFSINQNNFEGKRAGDLQFLPSRGSYAGRHSIDSGGGNQTGEASSPATSDCRSNPR